MDARKFRDIAGSFVTGVTIITAFDDQQNPVGMTVNSFTSLSLEPSLVQFNIDKKSSLFEAFTQAKSFAVNILAEDRESLSRQFSAKEVERFEGISFQTDTTGAPILEGVLGYFDCVVYKQYEAGDHITVIGEVVGGECYEGEPLCFYRGKYRNPAVI